VSFFNKSEGAEFHFLNSKGALSIQKTSRVVTVICPIYNFIAKWTIYIINKLQIII
jgi:hypothetical protein